MDAVASAFGGGCCCSLLSSSAFFLSGSTGSLRSALASAAAAETAAPPPPPRAGGGCTGAQETDTDGTETYPPASTTTPVPAFLAASDIRSAASLHDPRGTSCGAASPAVVGPPAPPP